MLLILGLILLALGLSAPAVVRRHLITLLIALELALLGVNLLFVFASLHLDDAVGQVFSLTILTVAGAESSIGLALLVVFHRLTGIISPGALAVLKG
jgi:NADH-quinone oxidoreductase subunit K